MVNGPYFPMSSQSTESTEQCEIRRLKGELIPDYVRYDMTHSCKHREHEGKPSRNIHQNMHEMHEMMAPRNMCG